MDLQSRLQRGAQFISDSYDDDDEEDDDDDDDEEGDNSKVAMAQIQGNVSTDEFANFANFTVPTPQQFSSSQDTANFADFSNSASPETSATVDPFGDSTSPTFDPFADSK